MISTEVCATGLRANQRLLSIESSPSDDRKQVLSERLSHGVCEPALIINDGPEFIAAVSCQHLKKCIFLRFSTTMSQFLRDNYQARKGTELLAVNTYLESGVTPSDIQSKSELNPYSNVHPIIAESLAENPEFIAQCKSRLGTDAYAAFQNEYQTLFESEEKYIRSAVADFSENVAEMPQEEIDATALQTNTRNMLPLDPNVRPMDAFDNGADTQMSLGKTKKKQLRIQALRICYMSPLLPLLCSSIFLLNAESEHLIIAIILCAIGLGGCCLLFYQFCAGLYLTWGMITTGPSRIFLPYISGVMLNILSYVGVVVILYAKMTLIADAYEQTLSSM